MVYTVVLTEGNLKDRELQIQFVVWTLDMVNLQTTRGIDRSIADWGGRVKLL